MILGCVNSVGTLLLGLIGATLVVGIGYACIFGMRWLGDMLFRKR